MTNSKQEHKQQLLNKETVIFDKFKTNNPHEIFTLSCVNYNQNIRIHGPITMGNIVNRSIHNLVRIDDKLKTTDKNFAIIKNNKIKITHLETKTADTYQAKKMMQQLYDASNAYIQCSLHTLITLKLPDCIQLPDGIFYIQKDCIDYYDLNKTYSDIIACGERHGIINAKYLENM